jgi:hypothetical protein
VNGTSLRGYSAGVLPALTKYRQPHKSRSFYGNSCSIELCTKGSFVLVAIDDQGRPARLQLPSRLRE